MGVPLVIIHILLVFSLRKTINFRAAPGAAHLKSFQQAMIQRSLWWKNIRSNMYIILYYTSSLHIYIYIYTSWYHKFFGERGISFRHKLAVVMNCGEKNVFPRQFETSAIDPASQETSVLWPQISFGDTPPKFNIEQEIWKIDFLDVLIVFGIFGSYLFHFGVHFEKCLPCFRSNLQVLQSHFRLLSCPPRAWGVHTDVKKLAQWPADINKRWLIIWLTYG